jgi:hypothetical protein
MNADLWGLVLGFALRLDLLDRACLADLRNCAQTCKALATAVTRVAKPAITLRARIHRVFDFKDPLKSHVRARFPNFLGDEFYASAPRGKPLCLLELAKHIIKYKDVFRWLTSAEGRPARLESAKRAREAEANAKVERRRLLYDELKARTLPVDESSLSFLDFVAGRTKTYEGVITAMEKLQQEQQVIGQVEERDKAFQMETSEARIQFLNSTTSDLGIVYDLQKVYVRRFLEHGDRSGPRVLACVVITQSMTRPHDLDFEQNLQRRTILRVGELMLEIDPKYHNFESEIALWLKAVKDVLSQFRLRIPVALM